MNEDIIYFKIEQEGLLDELNRLKRLLHKMGMKIKFYYFEPEGTVDKKYPSYDIIAPEPDGLIATGYSTELDVLLRNVEEFINHYKTLNDLE